MIEFGYYNADCMEIMKELPDKSIDIAIVDPVYGGVTQGGYMKNAESAKRKAKAIQYNTAVWDQPKTDREYFEELFRVSKNQVIWGGNYFANMLPPSQGWIVWDKQRSEGIKFADCELAWTSFNRATRIVRYRWDGFLQGDMKHKEKRIHPCQKPVNIYIYILRNYAKEGDTVLDTHVGSGSSLIACEQTGHKYIGIELDESYYAESKKRLDTFKAQVTIMDLMNDWRLP